ncbi:hypothetical protein CHS0354_009803, partial [Potamilus streckersoni]
MLLFQTLGVLCQDGIIRFINIHTCKLLFDVGTIENKINNATVSPNGRFVVAVNEDGSMNIYNLQALSEDINQKLKDSRLRVKSAPARGKENKLKEDEDWGQ